MTECPQMGGSTQNILNYNHIITQIITFGKTKLHYSPEKSGKEIDPHCTKALRSRLQGKFCDGSSHTVFPVGAGHIVSLFADD